LRRNALVLLVPFDGQRRSVALHIDPVVACPGGPGIDRVDGIIVGHCVTRAESYRVAALQILVMLVIKPAPNQTRQHEPAHSRSASTSTIHLLSPLLVLRRLLRHYRLPEYARRA